VALYIKYLLEAGRYNAHPGGRYITSVSFFINM